jgi:arylsulfatase
MVCQGGKFGGFSFYIKNGKPAFTYNFLGLQQYTVASPQGLKPGKHTIVYDFQYDGGGLGKGGNGIITVDGSKEAGGRIDKTQPGLFSVDDLADVGTDDGTWVTNYGASARFNGHLQKVTIQVHPANLSESDKAKESEMKKARKAAE